MASNHAASSGTFNDPISMLDGSDTRSATQLRQILEKLHDNTANLQSRLPAAASDTVAGLIEVADVSEIEAGTDTTRAVTPGRQHRHPCAAKFWAHVQVSGGTPTLSASYNVTSITDAGVGLLTVTIATDFSGAFWACSATVEGGTLYSHVSSRAAGSVQLASRDASTGASQTLTDPSAWNVVGYGDQ